MSKPRIWRRPRAAWLIGGLVLGLLYGPSVTSAAGDTWEGTWERTEVPGKSMTLTQTGSTVSGAYNWNDASGKVIGGQVSGATLTASFTETRYEGTFTLTLTGKSFTGTYTGKNKETHGPIEGNFDGTCIAGACLSNGAAPTPGPAVTPSSMPPALGKTTLYEAPAPGADQSYPLPKIAKRTRDLEGKIEFVDNQGNPVAGPDEVAVEAQAERALVLCYLFTTASLKELFAVNEEFGVGLPSFVTCVDAVSRVLARADEIKRAKGARVSSSARTCAVLVRGKGRAHPPLHMSCKATATGVSITIRPRSSNQTLAAALHGHAPKLIIGRSAVTPRPAGLRLGELWHARGKR